MNHDVRLLDTHQTYEFDTEYVNTSLFNLVDRYIHQQNFSNRNFDILDVGGGNGKYADRFIKSFPLSTCTVVEPEAYLVNKNLPNPRKVLINNTYQALPKESHYHAIQFNWVLHHFIGDSYNKSCLIQLDGIKEAFELLLPGGVILIFENFYESQAVLELSSWLIYQLTASSLIEKFTAHMGANTAGVGVCFHSEEYWKEQLSEVGFADIEAHHCYDFGNLSPLKKALLMIKHQRVGFIVARKPLT